MKSMPLGDRQDPNEAMIPGTSVIAPHEAISKACVGRERLATDTTVKFRTQLPRNLFMQVLSFVLHVGIGILLVPYLIKHLGRAAYGLIPIAAMMTQYVSLITQNVSAAVSRFLTIALQRDDVEDANSVYNTAFFSYLALGLIQIPLFGLIIYYASAIFTIPQELYRDAILLLICSAVSFLINLICSVFAVPIYANNRLDVLRIIDIFRMATRVVGIVVLFACFGPALRYVGYVDLSLGIVLCAVQLRLGRRLAPVLHLSIHCFDWRKVSDLLGMGCWLFVSQVGVLLFMRTDVWVCNRFIGPESAGDYAALLQWPTLVREAGGLIGTVVAPMTVICFARGEMENLVRLNRLSVRTLSLLLAIPISMLCVFSSSFLSLWLGPSYAKLSSVMVIMLCPMVINTGVSPLFNLGMAINKVKWPGIVTLAGGVANIFLAIILVKYFQWGVWGVAIAAAITTIARNGLFLPIYSAVILRQPWHTFLSSMLSGMLMLCALAAIAGLIRGYVDPTSWAGCLIVFAVVVVAGLALAWLCISARDRKLIVGLIPFSIRNIMMRCNLV